MTITGYRTEAGVGARTGGRRIGRRCASCDGDNYGWTAIRKWNVLVLVLCFCVTNALGAQRSGARDPKDSNLRSDEVDEVFDGRPGKSEATGKIEEDAKQQRHTPLGIQVPVERVLQKQRRDVAVESESNTLQRVGISQERAIPPRIGTVADGTVTVYTANGPIAFGVTLVQDGEHRSQRILLRQPDGKLWDGRPDHLALGAGPALEFLETQYRRGLWQLLNSREADASVEDNGSKDAFRVVTVHEDNGQSTKYSLDPTTSRLAHFEFARRHSQDPIGKMDAVVHSYSFADFRATDGIATPFHVDHFVNGEKQEELQLTNVRYNTSGIGEPSVRPAGR